MTDGPGRADVHVSETRIPPAGCWPPPFRFRSAGRLLSLARDYRVLSRLVVLPSAVSMLECCCAWI